MVGGRKMILFQIEQKKWDFGCVICCDFGTFGRMALPLEIVWWFSIDGCGNKCREISFNFLCFAIHFEYWRWKNEK